MKLFNDFFCGDAQNPGTNEFLSRKYEIDFEAIANSILKNMTDLCSEDNVEKIVSNVFRNCGPYLVTILTQSRLRVYYHRISVIKGIWLKYKMS